MNNQVTVFDNIEFGKLRTVVMDSVVYFVGKDVAEILGYSNTRDALARHVDTEDKSDVVIHDGSQNRTMAVINESGLYSLILSSKLKAAKKFKRWVTSEVLPAIRKTGSYSALSENPLDIQLVTITPGMAEEMLKRNIANRKVNQANVNRIAADMATGNYRINGETIKISSNGEILDGQHRLLACIKSGVPFKSYIVYNVNVKQSAQLIWAKAEA